MRFNIIKEAFLIIFNYLYSTIYINFIIQRLKCVEIKTTLVKQTKQVLKFITIQEENLIGHLAGHNKKKNLMFKKILIVTIFFI